MTNKLNWDVYSNKERYILIDRLKSIISNAGGYIINSIFYSDLAMNLTKGIDELNIKKFHSLLNDEVHVYNIDSEEFKSDSEKEWWIFLNVNFSKGKGNLKIAVPDVPG